MEQYISAIGQDSHRFVKLTGIEEPDFLNNTLEHDKSKFRIEENDICESYTGNSKNECTHAVTSTKKLILAGVEIPNIEGLDGNSDADVVFHALTNAISGISCVNVLGEITDSMCNSGITDSGEYLQYALNTLSDSCIVHVSISIECSRPKLSQYIASMRKSIAKRVGISENSVGITATSGEGLTDFGRGLGIQVFCIVTARRVAL